MTVPLIILVVAAVAIAAAAIILYRHSGPSVSARDYRLLQEQNQKLRELLVEYLSENKVVRINDEYLVERTQSELGGKYRRRLLRSD